MGDYEASLGDAGKAIELDPNLNNEYGSRGQTYFLMGDYEAALADFKMAEQLKKHDDYALVGQAVTHYALDNVETANHLWEQITTHNQNFGDVDTFLKKYAHAEPFADAIREVAALD